MKLDSPIFRTELTRDPDRVRLGQRLRYDVFVEELGASGDGVDHQAGLEMDALDETCEHLLLIDETRGGQVVGTYRLLDSQTMTAGQSYYSEQEFDLSAIRATGRRCLELGRSCLHADYRGGLAMHQMWSALTQLAEARGIDVLFGAASFPGTNLRALAEPLSLLHHRHLAPEQLRVRARVAATTYLVPETAIDKKSALRDIPPLIKAYLRLGGTVGDGVYVDHAFNTTDVCLVLDTSALNARVAALYGRGRA